VIPSPSTGFLDLQPGWVSSMSYILNTGQLYEVEQRY